jgi:hypothetical protein
LASALSPWFTNPVPQIVLTLISRRDCHLCDEMKAVVEAVAAGPEVRIEVRDVDSAPDLASQYGDEVPVLFVNGRKAFKYRVTPAELRRRLDAETRRGSSWWRRRRGESR